MPITRHAADWLCLLRLLQAGYCKAGDSVVAVHKIGAASVVKIIELRGPGMGDGVSSVQMLHPAASERAFAGASTAQ